VRTSNRPKTSSVGAPKDVAISTLGSFQTVSLGTQVNKGIKREGRGCWAKALGRGSASPYSLLRGSPLVAERTPSYGSQIHQLAWIWLGYYSSVRYRGGGAPCGGEGPTMSRATVGSNAPKAWLVVLVADNIVPCAWVLTSLVALIPK
jgi:hypothetical protein